MAPTDPNAAAVALSSWVGRRERGNPRLLALMGVLATRFGRRFALLLLRPIVAYFCLVPGTAGRHSRDYLARALGRAPGIGDRFRHFHCFAVTVLDRLYLAHGRAALLHITIEGEELLRALAARGGGAFILGAHLGSFEIMATIAARQPGLEVVMVMYRNAASRIAALLARAAPARLPRVIALGEPAAMLRVSECLEGGAFVGMLADREPRRDGPAYEFPFLGRPARLPTGPMRLAAALGVPVYFMTGLYRGGNRYHVVFRPLADFTQCPRSARDAAVRAAVERYALLLESLCRSDPYNWFNFYDFWEQPP